MYSGSYIESCAYNPSQGPLQSALSEFTTHYESYSEIAAILLIEQANPTVSQQAATQLVVKEIAPTIKLDVLHTEVV